MFSVRSFRRRSAVVVPSGFGARNVTVAAAAAPTRRVNRIVLCACTFRLVWWSVFLFHASCASFVFMLAAVHAILAEPEMFAYTTGSIQTPLYYLQSGACTFAVLFAAHVFLLARMVRRSIRQRQLALVLLKKRTSQSQLQHSTAWSSAQAVSSTRSTSPSCVARLTHAVYRWWQRYFSIDGLFGLNGEYFDAMFTLREVVEMLSQLYQTYTLSVSIATPWINRFALLVVLVNSLSSVTIRMACTLVNAPEPARHLTVLIVDVVLDFCGSILIPLCTLLPIVEEFDWTTMSVPMELISDVWLAQRMAEVRQLIITSPLDLLSSLALHVGVLGTMQTIACDFRRKQRSGLHPQAPFDAEPHPPERATGAFYRPSRRRHWLHITSEIFFVACGVLAFSAHRVFHRDAAQAPFCLLHVDAWFVRKFPCTVLYANCHAFSETDSIASLLASLDESVMVSLIVAHCAMPVEIPLQLNAFVGLRQLKFINVSSVAWAHGFVIDEQHHPQLSYVMFGHTNLSAFPPPLLHGSLPKMLREIEWSYSNVTTIPSEIGLFWGGREWLAIVFDHTQLRELPAEFFDVPCHELSLVDADIRSLPDDAFRGGRALRSLSVSRNPLVKLPASLAEASASSLTQVLAEETAITQLPDWLGDWSGATPGAMVSLYSSPVCEGSANATAAATPPPLVDAEACGIDRLSAMGVTNWTILWTFMPLEQPPGVQ